ncbi:hypothetical protein FB45DRAFT_917482, partial [Roridomyces roridus]
PVLPGQPIPIPPHGPIPQLGAGVYSRDNELRASLVGVPQQDGAVEIFYFRVYASNGRVKTGIIYFSCACPSSCNQLRCTWDRYPSFTSASNNRNIRGRRCAFARGGRVYGRDSFARCSRNRNGPGQDWRIGSSNCHFAGRFAVVFCHNGSERSWGHIRCLK